MRTIVFKIVKLVFLLTIFCNLQTASAQSPQKMSYQSIIRDAGNTLVANTNVAIKISILQGSPAGTVAYAETHLVVTNINGLAALEIGSGNVVSGDFSAINWANGPYFIKTETDPLGGTNYTISGTNQILSVPYALLAEKSVTPTYAVSASDDSTTFLTQTARNIWIDDPDIALVVPETGKYLLSFYGSAYNTNTYISSLTSYDGDAAVRVFNNTTSTQLLFDPVIRYLNDAESGTNAIRKFLPMDPKRTIMVNLTQGNVLKLQYLQYGYGSPAPTGSWIIGNGGISLLKIGN
jgi:hypothetical protein